MSDFTDIASIHRGSILVTNDGSKYMLTALNDENKNVKYPNIKFDKPNIDFKEVGKKVANTTLADVWSNVKHKANNLKKSANTAGKDATNVTLHDLANGLRNAKDKLSQKAEDFSKNARASFKVPTVYLIGVDNGEPINLSAEVEGLLITSGEATDPHDVFVSGWLKYAPQGLASLDRQYHENRLNRYLQYIVQLYNTLNEENGDGDKLKAL